MIISSQSKPETFLISFQGFCTLLSLWSWFAAKAGKSGSYKGKHETSSPKLPQEPFLGCGRFPHLVHGRLPGCVPSVFRCQGKALNLLIQ